MASPAYKNNGAIVIWWDESEKGDDLNHTVPEIVISPLAKRNGYASSVELNHSSDLKSREALFGLPFVTNAIPASETAVSGQGYNYVALVNDLSDLFVPGALPGAENFSVTSEPAQRNPHTQHVSQVVHVKNTGTSAVAGPLFLVLDNLPSGASLVNADGTTGVLAPLGSPYISLKLNGDDGEASGSSNGGDRGAALVDVFRPHESTTVKLDLVVPSGVDLSYATRVLSVTPSP